MQPARYQLAVVVAIALITGLLYSQVCALSCTVYGCLKPASSTEQNEQPAGHCHEQESKSDSSKSDSSKQNGLPDCPAHSELSVLISATFIKAAAFNLSLHAIPSTQEIVVAAAPPAGGLMLRPDQISFRAPPAYSILRI
jgi:hypothetical protein